VLFLLLIVLFLLFIVLFRYTSSNNKILSYISVTTASKFHDYNK